jgi:hypothetical protein
MPIQNKGLIMQTPKQYCHPYGSPSIQELISIVAFGDVLLLSKRLREKVLKKSEFIKLCNTAIDINNRYILGFLLDAYYQFWKQDVFDVLINYMLFKRSYELLGYINLYIDKVNVLLDEVDRLNSPPKDTIKKQSFVQRIIQKFKKH